jgi:HK97 family phage prohead protease
MSMIIRKTAPSEVEGDGRECILSNARPDRYGDILEVQPDSWLLDDYYKNNIVLLNHDGALPVGTMRNVRVENGALRGRLHLAPKGTSARLDEVRKLVDVGILKALSVGFMPVASSPIPKSGGTRFTKMSLCEVSLVSVPANADCLLACKALGISERTQQLVFKRSTLGERIRTAREAVAEEQRALTVDRLRRTNHSIANIKTRLAGTLTTYARSTLTKTLACLERAAREYTRELKGVAAPDPVRQAREAQAKRAQELQDRILDAEIARYTNDPWNGPEIERADYIARATERVNRLEADHLRRMRQQGRVVPEDFVPSPPGTVTWRGQVIPTLTWRGKPIK